MKLVSRQEAIASGAKRYFTGEPCPKGRIAARRVRRCDCVDCGKVASRAYYRKKGGASAEAQRRYKIRARAKNPEKLRSQALQYERKQRAKKIQTAEGVAYLLLHSARTRSAKSGYACDLTQEWLEQKIQEGLAKRVLRLGPKSPWSPSIDQSVAGLGYSTSNVNVVPLWYNFAKHTFDPSELHGAIAAWVAAQ